MKFLYNRIFVPIAGIVFIIPLFALISYLALSFGSLQRMFTGTTHPAFRTVLIKLSDVLEEAPWEDEE